MTWRIEIKPTPTGSTPTEFELGQARTAITIGRDTRCDVRLDDDLVASHHCRISLQGDTPTLENLDEEMGTVLDGNLVEHTSPLSGEHTINLATVSLSVRAVELHAESPVTSPPTQQAPEPRAPEPTSQDVEPSPQQAQEAAQAESPPEPTSVPALDSPDPSEPGAQALDHSDPATDNAKAHEEEDEEGEGEGDLGDLLAAAAALAGADPFADGEQTSAPTPEPEPEPQPDPETEHQPEPQPRPSPLPEPVPEAKPVPTPEHAAQSAPEPEPEPQAQETFEVAPLTQTGSLSAPRPATAFETDLDPDVAHALGLLRGEFTDAQLGLLSPELVETIEPIVEHARELGFTGEDLLAGYLRCVVLVGDPLIESAPSTQDLWFTLSHTSRPAEQRLRRASRIAERAAEGKAPKGMPIVAQPPQATHDTARATPPLSTQPAPARSAPVAPETAPKIEGAPSLEGYTVFASSDEQSGTFRARAGSEQTEVLLRRLTIADEATRGMVKQRARAGAAIAHPALLQKHRVAEQDQDLVVVSDAFAGPTGSGVVASLARAGGADAGAGEIRSALGLDSLDLAQDVIDALSQSDPFHTLVAVWARGLSLGLAASHEAGLAHRDLRPASLALAWDGTLVITDLGTAVPQPARAGTSAGPHAGTTTSTRWGTPPYASPERLAAWINGEELPLNEAVRADLWSLGAILYDLICLRPIFTGSAKQLVHAVLTREPEAPVSINAKTPAPLGELCRGLLSRDPDQRPASAEVVAARIAAFVEMP